MGSALVTRRAPSCGLFRVPTWLRLPQGCFLSRPGYHRSPTHYSPLAALCYLSLWPRRQTHMPTRVQIYGQTYSIAGDLDPAYVQKLAAYVDEKMRSISDTTSTVDTQKAAVLAALAIAD